MKILVPLIIGVLAIFAIGSSCSPDPDPQPTEDHCPYSGFSSDISDTNYNQFAESALTTDFFYTSSNGPEVEIYKTSNGGDFNFTTTVVTLNGTGTGILRYAGSNHTVQVTCHKTGAAIGDEMQYTVVGTNFTGHFCVIIDQYH